MGYVPVLEKKFLGWNNHWHHRIYPLFQNGTILTTWQRLQLPVPVIILRWSFYPVPWGHLPRLRAADVMLKERKRLVLAVRETPLNRTHLLNMLAVHDAGATLCPTMPSYYLKPKSLEEAAKTYAWRLADQVGINIPNRKRW